MPWLPPGLTTLGAHPSPTAALGDREADEAPHRRREHRRRAFDRDGLRRAEHEADRQHRAPAGRVDHARRADDLQPDPQPERQAAGRASSRVSVGAQRERDHGDADEHADRAPGARIPSARRPSSAASARTVIASASPTARKGERSISLFCRMVAGGS